MQNLTTISAFSRLAGLGTLSVYLSKTDYVGNAMPWKVEYLPEREMVLAVATGVFYEGDANGLVAEVVRLLRLHHANLVLVDHTEALTEVRLATLYSLPDYATELQAPWNLHVAVVTPRTRYRIETYEFFELVSRNAGYDVKLFGSKEAAEHWLFRASPFQASAK